MPVYRISCRIVKYVYVYIEAPSRDAVDKYYDRCDGSDFNPVTPYQDWELDNIEQLPPADVTGENIIAVDADGQYIEED